MSISVDVVYGEEEYHFKTYEGEYRSLDWHGRRESSLVMPDLYYQSFESKS